MAVKSPTKSSKATKPRKSATESIDHFSASRKIDEMIVDLGDWRGEWLSEIRRLIHQVDSAVVEDWKWRGIPVWSHEEMYANANAFKDKVKLTFFHGAQIPDPGNLFNTG